MKSFKSFLGKICLFATLLVLLVFIIPIIINESYKFDKGYVTLWAAADVLSFYAVILSGIITISIFVLTIYFSKKDTEKQLNFYLSQNNVPLFIIEKVCNKDENKLYYKSKDNVWKKEVFIEKPKSGLEIKKEEDSLLVLHLNNIGDGLALDFSMCEKNDCLLINKVSPIIRQNDTFQVEINTKQFLKNIGSDNNSYELILYYKNASGIFFMQSMKIVIEDHKENNKIIIGVSDTSSRENTIINM